MTATSIGDGLVETVELTGPIGVAQLLRHA